MKQVAWRLFQKQLAMVQFGNALGNSQPQPAAYLVFGLATVKALVQLGQFGFINALRWVGDIQPSVSMLPAGAANR